MGCVVDEVVFESVFVWVRRFVGGLRFGGNKRGKVRVMVGDGYGGGVVGSVVVSWVGDVYGGKRVVVRCGLDGVVDVVVYYNYGRGGGCCVGCVGDPLFFGRLGGVLRGFCV